MPIPGKKFCAGVVIAALLIGGLFYYKYRVAPSLAFYELQLIDLDGNPVKLEKGSNLLVNFFATWCGPCVHEIPLLEAIWEEMANDGNVRFVLISDEPLTRLKRFSERTKPSIIIYHSKQKLKDLGIHTVPTSYLLNARNEVVLKKTGSFEGTSGEIARELSNLCR